MCMMQLIRQAALYRYILIESLLISNSFELEVRTKKLFLMVNSF